MSWRCIALALPLIASPAFAQQPQTETPAPTALPFVPGELTDAPTILPIPNSSPGNDSGFLTGNHAFPNFINFISNPLMSIDPRAVTAIYPIFGSEWISTASPIPDGNAQLYGPAISVALSDRLAVGLSQGGLVDAHLSSNPAERLRILQDERLAELLSPVIAARIDTRDFSGDRFGFLNLGGFVQYTLIQDVPNQFLFTVGMRWEAPAGSHEVFQGYGPAELASYFTAGKEFGEYHVLLTGGYEFPVGPGSDNSNLFYANVHFDRRCFGWLYPLVEFNCIYQEKGVDFGLTTRRGFFDFGNFESTGNIATLAAGANAVIVPERLEIGAVYTTVIASQHDFEANGLIVKMTIRY
jgi:hypothetical protein